MRQLLLAGVLAVVLAGCGGTRTIVRTVTVAQPLGGSGDQTYYGRIVSLTPSGTDYVLRFDPSWLVSGVTAGVAAAQDEHTTCSLRACSGVPNDCYDIDETHRALTFLIPGAVRGSVLTRNTGPGSRVGTTRVTAKQLRDIVAGTSHLELFEPLESGVWIRVQSDTVRAFAQQYRP